MAVRPQPGRQWIGPAVGLAVGVLVGRLLPDALQRPESGIGVEGILLVAGGMIAGLCVLLRRRARARRRDPVAPAAVVRDPAIPETELDRGVRDIRRTDRGFDPVRFAGYAAMMLRDVHGAHVARNAGALRDRLTPAMYVELEGCCDRLRTSGRSARVAEMEVRSEVTEAWQEGQRDYVTAYVGGSMLSHTVDDVTGKVVDGSPATPTPIEAFLTFTRPAGLNFWMLSIIQKPG